MMLAEPKIPHRPEAPSRALLASVLRIGIMDAIPNNWFGDDAMAWIEEASATLLHPDSGKFMFEGICVELDLCPETVRKRVRELRDRNARGLSWDVEYALRARRP